MLSIFSWNGSIISCFWIYFDLCIQVFYWFGTSRADCRLRLADSIIILSLYFRPNDQFISHPNAELCKIRMNFKSFTQITFHRFCQGFLAVFIEFINITQFIEDNQFKITFLFTCTYLYSRLSSDVCLNILIQNLIRNRKTNKIETRV